MVTKIQNKSLIGCWPSVAIFSLLLVACGGQTPEQKVLEHTAQQIILPLYTELNAETGDLVERVDGFCAVPAAETQLAAQHQWRRSMEAWAGVQPIDFGPLEDNNLRWKLHFWPDRKDLARKKIEAMLAGDSELTVERVSTGSVSVQGLAAIEYLLFDQHGGALTRYLDDIDGRRCQLLQAISNRVEQVTGQLVSQWAGNEQQSGFAVVFSAPGAENPRYPDDKAALAALLSSLVVGTEVVKRNKLGIPLNNGKGPTTAKPYRLEAWRSQHSLALMQASMKTLENLYRGEEGKGLVSYLANQNAIEPALLEKIDEGFAAVNGQFSKLQSPLFGQLKKEQPYADLVVLYKQLDGLQRSLSQLPERLDINLGFNSNDGD